MGYPDSEPSQKGCTFGPELAEAEPVVSRDGKTYTFTVRKDARFSDGKRVTARAFAHALERILTPAMESPLGVRVLGHRRGQRRCSTARRRRSPGAVAKGRNADPAADQASVPTSASG